MNISLSAFAPVNLVSGGGFGSLITRQPAHLHTHAESGAYLRNSSRVPRWHPFIYLNPPYAIGLVPSLSGHAIIAYRWCLLPNVRRHRASKPQGRTAALAGHHGPINMRLSFPHIHCWYKVGVLKIPVKQPNDTQRCTTQRRGLYVALPFQLFSRVCVCFVFPCLLEIAQVICKGNAYLKHLIQDERDAGGQASVGLCAPTFMAPFC